MRKTALITGGSSGLGLAMAKQLADQGYDLFLIARDPLKLNAARDSITQATPEAKVGVFPCDIADQAALQEVFAQIRGQISQLDFLIINAGVATIDLIRDYESVDIITRNLQVNLVAAITTAYFGMPLLKPGSRMLFVSSGFAYVGPAGYALYAAAKAGMNNFAEAMRREMMGRQVQVHVTCPGDIDTPMYQGELDIMPDWMRHKKGRAQPRSADTIARYVLAKCFKNHFLIIPSSDVRMVLWMQRLLPRWLVTYIVDRLLPLPS